MTNNTAHTARTYIMPAEVAAYQLPGHTLVRVWIDAEYAIEGDFLVNPWGNIMPAAIVDTDMETRFIGRFELADGTACRRFAPITEKHMLRVMVARNVPVTD